MANWIHKESAKWCTILHPTDFTVTVTFLLHVIPDPAYHRKVPLKLNV